MLRMAKICLILAIGINTWAQNVALSGKVTNQSGKTISGATVVLMSKNLTATTNSSGTYTITGTAVVTAASIPQGVSVTMVGGNILVNLARPEAIRIELFDVRGNLLGEAVDNPAIAGNYRFDVHKHPLAAKMMVVRVSIGRQTSTFRYMPLNGRMQAIGSADGVVVEGMLSKQLATVDTLKATKSGYKEKKVPVSSYEGTFDIVLDTNIVDPGTCTASKPVNLKVTVSGPHKVVMETNSDAGIKEGTIYRPEDLAPGKNYPILIWGQGACSRDGRGAEASNAEIASYGYVVIADGTPTGGGAGLAMNLNAITPVARAYAKWIIAENRKPCSAYYQSVDTTKVAANGFSCGGLFGMALAGDPYIATWGVSSSGCLNGNGCPETWNVTHTPVIIIEGNSGDPGYANGLRDYNGIAALKKWPVYFISNKKMGHGGDLWNANGGNFTKIHLSWLNWWIKGDTTATTGKGVLVGPSCKYCTNSDWEIKSANIP